jgi:hypothetical protein
MLPEIDAFGDGEILGERGLADQTNSAPLFPRGLSMTSLPAEANGTANSTVSEGAKGGSIFPTLPSLTWHAHNSHLNINKEKSSFNNVDLLSSMSADCCMPRRQEWGTMAVVGGQWPP